MNFNNGDGSGREPRDVQTKALQWLASNWNMSRVFAINAPVASGKSFIARAIQREMGGLIMTPSNLLLDQYVTEYGMNYVKGRNHYTSPDGLSCDDECPIVLRQKACPGCPYKAARSSALDGVPTIFNPASLFYLKGGDVTEGPRVVDEAHTLPGFLQQLSSVSLSKVKYGWTDKQLSELEFTSWLKDLIRRLELVAESHADRSRKDYRDVIRDLDRMRLTLQAFKEAPENYALYIDRKPCRGRMEEYLNVAPIKPARYLTQAILGTGKVILMSGTLFEHDIRALIGDEDYVYLGLDSPIPADRRPVYFRPINSSVTHETPAETIAEHIDKIATAEEGQNTIVHLSYSDAGRVSPVLQRTHYTNTKKNKQKVLSEYREKGGLFLAAGCAEGIDLPDDLCRVQYIPRLLKPNLGDPVVKKRKALIDGQQWYDIETLKMVIQQLGRSCRHEKDWTRLYIGDPMFARLVSKYYKLLPKYFTDSIKWC